MKETTVICQATGKEKPYYKENDSVRSEGWELRSGGMGTGQNVAVLQVKKFASSR